MLQLQQVVVHSQRAERSPRSDSFRYSLQPRSAAWMPSGPLSPSVAPLLALKTLPSHPVAVIGSRISHAVPLICAAEWEAGSVTSRHSLGSGPAERVADQACI